MKRPHVRFAAILAAAYLVALVLVAFWATPVDRALAPELSRALAWLHANGLPSIIGYNAVEFGANIVLFIPLGAMAGALARGSWWPPLAAGLAVSCLIELGQALLRPERVPSVLDIVANTFGAALGVGVSALLRTARSRREKLFEPPR